MGRREGNKQYYDLSLLERTDNYIINAKISTWIEQMRSNYFEDRKVVRLSFRVIINIQHGSIFIVVEKNVRGSVNKHHSKSPNQCLLNKENFN